jgi:hypothetical protein
MRQRFPMFEVTPAGLTRSFRQGEQFDSLGFGFARLAIHQP